MDGEGNVVRWCGISGANVFAWEKAGRAVLNVARCALGRILFVRRTVIGFERKKCLGLFDDAFIRRGTLNSALSELLLYMGTKLLLRRCLRVRDTILYYWVRL